MSEYDQPATYDDVMAELRARNPETDGRWTASQAAAIYGEMEQFEAEAGIAEARERALDPNETEAGQLQASQDYMAGQVIADSTRNRYQQTTGFDRSAQAAEQFAGLDAGYQASQADLAIQSEPGLDSSDQWQAQADRMEYGWLTGNEAMMDPDYQSAGLSPQQQADLPGLREAESQAFWAASNAREQRFQESRERVEALMETPFEEREREYESARARARISNKMLEEIERQR